jgi:hypothetical protein
VSLGLRWYYARRWLLGRPQAFREWRARHMSTRMRRAVLVRLAVDATSPDLIGMHAYAGPDGVDYERLWWACERKLPPGRRAEITTPVE